MLRRWHSVFLVSEYPPMGRRAAQRPLRTRGLAHRYPWRPSDGCTHALRPASGERSIGKSVQAVLPCQAAPDGMTVEIDDDTDYEPDALVNCGDPIPDEATAAPNPVVVVEVLSPRTAKPRRRRQARGLLPPSLGTAIPAGPTVAPRDHPASPASANVSIPASSSDAVELDPPGIRLTLDEIYGD